MSRNEKTCGEFQIRLIWWKCQISTHDFGRVLSLCAVLYDFRYQTINEVLLKLHTTALDFTIDNRIDLFIFYLFYSCQNA